MSWPSIWQNQNQTVPNQQNMTAQNVFLTPEQQYTMQQQSWQQWQIYQQQLAQWQTQYGDQINAQAMGAIPNMYMAGFVPPPLPIEQTAASHPPPPPPPQQDATGQLSSANLTSPSTTDTTQQLPSLLTTQIQPNDLPLQSPSSNVDAGKPVLQSNKDRFNDNRRDNMNDDAWDSHQNRRNNRNNNRNWTQNNRNNNSRNPFSNNFNSSNNRNENNKFQSTNPIDPDAKSQEEIEFDEQYRQWEERFEDWKRENSNHVDRQRYNDFVSQMENCRQSMLKRRDNLRQKRLNQLGLTNNQSQYSSNTQMSQNKDDYRDHGDAKSQSASSSSLQLFGSSSNDGNGGIPGLDLVHSGNSNPIESHESRGNVNVKSETLPSINITQILDDPNIKSLLSNIQRQQQQQQQNDVNQGPSHNNSFNTPSGSDDNHQNPFRNNNFQNNRDKFMKRENQNDYNDGKDFGERPNKRECRWNDNNQQQYDRFQQNDRNFSREQSQSQNQSFNTQSFRNNPKRSRNDDQSYFDNSNRDNFNEFRPIQVFDYQNQRQNQSKNMPSFVQQPTFAGNRLKQLQGDEYFPRKVYEYNNRSKIYEFNEWCPIIQIEYNHTSKGFSLHEHPPIKQELKIEKVKPEPTYNPPYGPKGEFLQLRQPQKWESRQRNWRYQPYQSKYENERYDYRQNSLSSYQQQQQTTDNQSYYRRNQQDRSWTGSSRDYDDNYYNNNDRYQQRTATAGPSQSNYNVKVEDNPKIDIKSLLFPPGRNTRPNKIVILMRGPPGSGKSFVAKAIKDKESELNGSARILSIDDYFTTESDDEVTLPNGRMAPKSIVYQYEAAMEERYMQFLIKSFKKTLSGGLFNLIILDCNNITLQYLPELHSISTMHQYTPYVCEMPLDEEKCIKNNIHNRSQSDIKRAIFNWVRTPSSYTLLKYESLFNDADATEAISDIEEDKEETFDAISDDEDKQKGDTHLSDIDDDVDDDEDGTSNDCLNEFGVFKSKWDNDTTENKMARMDGTNKPMKHATFEDYLQMDGWEPPPSSTNGKKRVRWADIEEKRDQDKQRALGFVVGQTNWDNLMNQPRDHRDGTTALTKIKYIEKVKK